MRCDMYPYDSYSHLNSFRESQAHYLLSGTPKPFFCLERGDQTNIGFRHITSILGYQYDIPQLNFILKALVAAQRVENGSAPSPIQEDRLMSALFQGLSFIIFKIQTVTTAMETQFTLIVSIICQQGYVWKSFISEVPTLLTNKAISRFLSQSITLENLRLLEESLKLKTIYFNFESLYYVGRNLERLIIVSLSFSSFLEMSTILNPS